MPPPPPTPTPPRENAKGTRSRGAQRNPSVERKPNEVALQVYRTVSREADMNHVSRSGDDKWREKADDKYKSQGFPCQGKSRDADKSLESRRNCVKETFLGSEYTNKACLKSFSHRLDVEVPEASRYHPTVTPDAFGKSRKSERGPGAKVCHVCLFHVLGTWVRVGDPPGQGAICWRGLTPMITERQANTDAINAGPNWQSLFKRGNLLPVV